MSELEPTTLEQADLSLERTLRGFHRLRWAALGVLIAVLTLAVIAVWAIILGQNARLAQEQRQIDQEQRQVAAACHFFADLAGLPLDPVPPVKRPSRAVVSIVADSRATVAGFGCADIPPPTASLRKWAAYYHLGTG